MKKATLLLYSFLTPLLLVFIGCASTHQAETVTLLKQAGFKSMAATTFERQEKLKALKPDRISTVKGASGTVYYVYPLHGQNLLYAGRAAEFSTYQNLLATMKSEKATIKAEQPGADASWTNEAAGGESWREVWTAPED